MAKHFCVIPGRVNVLIVEGKGIQGKNVVMLILTNNYMVTVPHPTPALSASGGDPLPIYEYITAGGDSQRLKNSGLTTV